MFWRTTCRRRLVALPPAKTASKANLSLLSVYAGAKEEVSL